MLIGAYIVVYFYYQILDSSLMKYVGSDVSSSLFLQTRKLHDPCSFFELLIPSSMQTNPDSY